jgi:dihydrofolate reductase
MRKIIVFNRITLDGFFAGPNGEIDWFIPDPELDQEMMFDDKVGNPGVILFGRVTYEMFESYWPNVAKGATDLEFSPRGAEAQTAEKKIADLLTKMSKLVFSKKPLKVNWENTRAVNSDLFDEVRRLKKENGPDIIIFGSGTLVQQLTDAQLIDEYLLILTPVVLGKGKLLFDDVKRSNFKLMSAKDYPSGNVLLKYGSNFERR